MGLPRTHREEGAAQLENHEENAAEGEETVVQACSHFDAPWVDDLSNLGSGPALVIGGMDDLHVSRSADDNPRRGV
jgi:hypothetical protein